MNTLFYATLWLTVNITLCLLFWLLAFQNRAEKNLLFIAITTTLLTLVIFCEVYSDPRSSFFVYRFAVLALPIVRAVAMISAIILMLRIFKRKITLLLKIASSALFIGGIVQLLEEKKEQAIKQQKILQEEVNRQTAEIRTTLENLRSTQSQLIQSEKMASLGELTAGIAHEIQNPLNFVNNFSEVNKELIEELKSEKLKVKSERYETLENELIN